MPTVGELFHSLDREDVVSAIMDEAPEESPDGLREAWITILGLVPRPAEVKECNCFVLFSDSGFDVHGRSPNGTCYGLEFMPWAEWLDMPVTSNQHATNLKLLSCILQEMTFIAYEERAIADKFDSIVETRDEIAMQLGCPTTKDWIN